MAMSSLSVHGSSGPRRGAGEQHGRRGTGEDRLGGRGRAQRHGQPGGPVLPERKRPDGEERTGLRGDHSAKPTATKQRQ